MTNLTKLVELMNKNQGSIMAALTLVYVLTTVGLAIIALLSVRLTRRQLALAVEFERSRTRPHVLLDLILRPPWVLAVLKNVGQSAGYDLKFSLTPELKIVLGGKNFHPSEEREIDIAFITKGIPVIPPGREIETIIGTWSRFEGKYPKLHLEGSASYRDAQGHEYKEVVVLDLNSLKGLLHKESKDINDVAKQLEEISKEIHHIGTGFHKPLVRTISENQSRREEENLINELTEAAEQPNLKSASEEKPRKKRSRKG